MSEQTSTPSDDESKGTFVDGSLGRTEDASKDAPPADPDPEPGEPSYLLEAGEGPADESAGADVETDVEGTGTEPSPGERNEPV